MMLPRLTTLMGKIPNSLLHTIIYGNILALAVDANEIARRKERRVSIALFFTAFLFAETCQLLVIARVEQTSALRE